MSEEMIVIDNRSDEIKLVNQRQVFLYVKNGLQPIRLESGYDDKLVYVFLVLKAKNFLNCGENMN